MLAACAWVFWRARRDRLRSPQVSSLVVSDDTSRGRLVTAGFAQLLFHGQEILGVELDQNLKVRANRFADTKHRLKQESSAIVQHATIFVHPPVEGRQEKLAEQKTTSGISLITVKIAGRGRKHRTIDG